MIYLFDKDEKLIKIIRKPAIKTALQKYSLTKERYVSDRLTVEMKSLNDDELEKVEYMAIQTMEDAHTFHYFYVAQKSSENLTTLIGVQSGIEELRKSPVFDKRPKNAFAKNVINDLLKGTNWQARFVGETTQRSTSFYYISVFDALKKACEVWDLEMQFFVEMNGNRIGARYIDFKRKIGQAVGKRVVYGHNALQILQEVERTNIFTALVGRGKGEQVSSAEESGKQANDFGRKITFEDVVWSTASGKPINKPKGQKYVELPAMTKLYGIKNADGSMRPKIGFVEFAEEENPEVLIERTYKALVDAARPQLTLKTSSVYLRGAKVGDTIRVVRHDKKLDYDTRIFEITFNRLNDQSSDIKLGDRIGESNEAKAQTIAEKVVDDFVSNEFSDFVQKLPDFLPSPDGFNNNWYGAEDPTVKYPGKVLINDIWFKPDPEHEGHKIMLRWTGEVWDEILRSYDKELLTKRISEEIANFDKTFQSVNEQNKKKIDEILQSSGASTLLAQEAKRIGERARADITNLQASSQNALNQIESFKTQYGTKLNEVKSTADGLLTKMGAVETYISKDGQRQESLQRYARDESAKQATAVRELVARDYVGKSSYQEDVRGIERRFSEIATQTNNAIASKIAQYKQTVDGQFASITSQVAGKANQTDFQRVKETSQLYERILGNTDNGIADNVARMAMTSQLFQVEVGKYSVSGPNLVKNSDFKDGTSEWSSTQNFGRLVKHGFYHNSQKDIMRLSNSTQSENFLYSPRFELERNTDYVLNFRGFNNSALASYDVYILGRRAGESNGFTIIKQVVSSKKLSTSRCEDVSVTFNSEEIDNAFIRFDNNGSRSGTADLYITEVDLYKGYKPRPWQPHPEDVITDANAKLEAIRTQMTLLQGSWSVQNLTSAGSIVSQINATNNQILIEAEKIRLKGKTLLDELTAIQGYFKRLFVGEGTFATLNADVIRTNSITADKLVFNEALANRLVSNEIITSKLVASRAFVNALNAVTIDASQIVTGTLKGDRIFGGTIRGTSIYGGTLTGHTKIQLGSYGLFDTVNGGLQINVPRDYNAKDGLGVQFIGSYGRGENVPYGLFIYKDSDFTVGGTAETSDDFLLTVEGYINAKGIGWLKTGKGSVNGKTTGTIGLWNSDNVSLSFGGSGNDIYYSYNGTAYSLWSVVNQHFSDRRLKDNIVACEHKALDYIHQFQFKEYDWKKQEDRPQQAHTKIGLIAQEVQAVDPTLVYENGDTLNLDNLRLTNIALKAIQELSQRIETLERKLA